MATETLSLGSDPGGSQFYSGGMGAFFKFLSAPSSTMALMDLYSGGAYVRFSLKSDLTIFFEHTTGWSVPNATSTALSTGVWYWISVGFGADGNQDCYSELYIHYAGGVAYHSTPTNNVFHQGRVDVTGILGLGVPLSSAYLSFPNSSGWAWAKPRIIPGSGTSRTSPAGLKGGAIGEISSDWASIGSVGGAWNNREALGSTGNLADASSNNISLIPASQGLLVILDGPYP